MIVNHDAQQEQADLYDRAAFDDFARSLGAVPLPIRVALPDGRAPNGNGPNGNGHTKTRSREYQRMVREAKAFFGDAVREKLTEMLVPYQVTDTHDLSPAQCAEISEKIEIMQTLC